MKHLDSCYFKIGRRKFQELCNNKELTVASKYLFVVLKELEHRYTGRNKHTFIRSLRKLSIDSGLSYATVQKCVHLLAGQGYIDLVLSGDDQDRVCIFKINDRG